MYYQFVKLAYFGISSLQRFECFLSLATSLHPSKYISIRLCVILRLISISTDCIATFLDLEILPNVKLAQLSCLGDFFVGDQSYLS